MRTHCIHPPPAKCPSTGPTPIELINQFLAKPHATHPVSVQSISEPSTPNLASSTAAAAVDPLAAATDPIEAFHNIGRKQLAQKILSLKVASHLHWDLSIFERNLTLQKQVQLLGDLCTVTAGKIIQLPIGPDADLAIGPQGNVPALRYALTLYHRWVLRTQLLKELPPRLTKGLAAASAAAAAVAASSAAVIAAAAAAGGAGGGAVGGVGGPMQM